ncbi:MAG: sulfite exporter TauE/SafE family protein [Fimbriimonadales bacterium]|nr:sulfite exporter TauE/SafE family protein [Fimbriimonadales bacterium]
MAEAAFSVLIGLLAGSLSGLFGIGGGIGMIPAMTLLMGFDQKKAQGTSLAAMLLPIGLPAVVNYWKAGGVDAKVAGLIVAGFVAGAYASSRYAVLVPDATLRRAFAVLLVAIAIQLWLKK